MHNLNKGLYTALITPFLGGKIDYTSLEKLIDFQIQSGVHSIVLCGTTGESSTLSLEEKLQIAEFTVNFCKGRLKIILNTGTNNTETSVKLTKEASKLNIDGILAIAPYYNKTNKEGLILHFTKIAESTHLPVILYNVPARTGFDLSDDITAHLYKNVKNIVGLKDATGDISRVISIRLKTDKNFLLLSGEDTIALAFNSIGGDGVISVVSNVVPKLMQHLQTISLKRTNLEDAFEAQAKIYQISKILFKEVNPIPVKYLAFLMNLCNNEYRLPLCQPSNEVIEDIKKILVLC